MKFMNTWDIDEARARHRAHPILGPATATLVALRNAVDANSDGWAYWPKPARAARKLMELICGDGIDPFDLRMDSARKDATAEKLKAAYAPIKAFRTRGGLKFDVTEPSPGAAHTV